MPEDTNRNPRKLIAKKEPDIMLWRKKKGRNVYKNIYNIATSTTEFSVVYPPKKKA